MSKKLRVLWIEESARSDLPHLAAPVYMDGRYDLAVAESASLGLYHLERRAFDSVVVDIRLPPGEDLEWRRAFRDAGEDKVAARLGIRLLRTILGHPRAEIKLESRPSWISANKIAVLSVESWIELEDDLQELGIKQYRQKTADMPDTVLLQLIESVIRQQT